MKTAITGLVAVGLLLGAPLAKAEDDFPVKKVLTLQAAMKAASAAQAEATKHGATVVIAGVDDGGHLFLLHRLDDTQVASVVGAAVFR